MATYNNPGIDPALAKKVVITDANGTIVPVTGGGLVAGGTYYAAGVTLVDAQSAPFLLDSQGNLRVNPGALTSASDSVTVVAPGAGNASSPAVSLLYPTPTATTAVIARPTRTGVTFFNPGPVSVFLGLATATASTSFPLYPGASFFGTSQTLIQAATNTATGALWSYDEFN